jgi:hypothetical protein
VISRDLNFIGSRVRIPKEKYLFRIPWLFLMIFLKNLNFMKKLMDFCATSRTVNNFLGGDFLRTLLKIWGIVRFYVQRTGIAFVRQRPNLE